MTEPLTWAERVAGAIRHSSTRHIGVVQVYYPILEGSGLRATVNDVCSGWRKVDVERLPFIYHLLAGNRTGVTLPVFNLETIVDMLHLSQSKVRGKLRGECIAGTRLAALRRGPGSPAGDGR